MTRCIPATLVLLGLLGAVPATVQTTAQEAEQQRVKGLTAADVTH